MTALDLVHGNDRHLSRLDESGVLADRHTVVDADNATLVLLDADGRERVCTDMMSAYASVNFGHRNPYIERALRRGSDIAALFYPPEAGTVAEWLSAAVGDGDRRVLYQVGGSFAVSSAFALARRRRPGRILSVEGAFHGLGLDSMAATTVQRDIALQDTGLSALLGGEIGQLRPGELPTDWAGVSGVIYEPVQGANGYVPLDPDWLAALTASAKAAGVTTISDEIQCGFHRHGPLSPSTALGLDPDVVLFGKSLTNGVYPLSAVVYRARMDGSPAGAVHLAHTFQTGALGFLAAWRVAEYLAVTPVAEMAELIAVRFRAAAQQWSAAGVVRDVHVTGPSLSFEPTGPTSRELVATAFRHGVLVFSGGVRGQRIRIAPPLTIPADQLDTALTVIGHALADRSH